MTRTQFGYCAALLLAASVVSGCKPDEKLPTAEIKNAKEAIAQAERAGAVRYAQDDFQKSQTALQQAEEAHSHGNDAISNLRAVEAATLAAKAATAASSGEAQRADAAIAQATGAENASDGSTMPTEPTEPAQSEPTQSQTTSPEISSREPVSTESTRSESGRPQG